MPDDRTFELLGRLEVEAAPSATFSAALLTILEPRVRHARRQDLSAVGRLRRGLVRGTAARGIATNPRAPWLLLAGAILVMIAVLILVGAQRASNGPLAYVSGSGVWLVDPDGAPRRITTVDDGFGPIAAAPDGTRVAVVYGVVPDAAANAGVRWIDLASGKTTDVPIPASLAPSWSSHDDLAWMAWSAGAAGTNASDDTVVLLRDGASQATTWRTPGSLQVVELRWSPDGRTLAVLAAHDRSDPNNAGTRLFLVDSQTLSSRVADDSNLDFGSLAWSPDSRWLAGTALQPLDSSGSTDGTLAIFDAAGGPTTRIPTSGRSETATTWTWAADSETLLVAAQHPDGDGRYPIWRTTRDGSARTELASTSQPASGILMAPDGSHYALWSMTPGLPVPSEGGNMSLFAGSMAGGDPVHLADGVFYAINPAWSPGSDWLVYVRAPVRDGSTDVSKRELWITRQDGTGGRQIVIGVESSQW